MIKKEWKSEHVTIKLEARMPTKKEVIIISGGLIILAISIYLIKFLF